MKKGFIAIILLLCCVSAIVLGTTSAFGTMEDEGFAIPADAGIARALTSGGSTPVRLAEIHRDDVIYKSLAGCYVGDKREKIDLTFPLYTNGGTGLRFLDEENWLLTTDVDLFRSYDGLYVSDGISYNADMTQADGGEFILLALSSGLYMNVQQAVLETKLGATTIPINSILSLREDGLRWYEQKNGTIAYQENTSVYEATLTIGRHTYDYADLLDALGLVRGAIQKADNDHPDAEQMQQAEEILNKKGSSTKLPSAGGNTNDHVSGTTDGTAGDTPAGGTTGGSSTGGGGGAGSGGSLPSDGGGSGTTTKPGEGGDPGAGGGSGGSGGEAGNKPSTGGSSTGGDPDIGGGGEGGNGGASGGDDVHPDEPDTKPGEGDSDNSKPAPYQDPKVTIRSIEPWSYALGLDVQVDDLSGVIMRGINFSVFKKVKGSGATTTDENGRKVYPADDYKGSSTMLRRNRVGTQAFALSVLEPGQTVYFQYQYRYNAQVKYQDETTGEEIIRVERKYFYSDLVEIKLPTVTEGKVAAVAADWGVEYAAKADALQLRGLTLANTANYDPQQTHYSFENFKKNTLPYVNRLELELTPVGGGDKVTVAVGSFALAKAQQQGGVDFASTSPKLHSNTAYTYTVRAKDRFGMELPLETESITGSIYTRKAAPVVTVTEKDNVMDALTLQIKVSDPDGALTAGKNLLLRVSDSRTGTAAGLYGEWDTSKISAGGQDVTTLELKAPKDGSTYELTLKSLAFSCLYGVEVSGDYQPQPDVADTPAQLPEIKNECLGSLTVYTASLSSGLITFQSGVSDLKDTSVTMEATMTRDTTLDILPLVDEFRVLLRDAKGNTVSQTTLAKTDLRQGDNFRYNKDEASVELIEGNHKDPRVVLYGTQDKYRNDNPWDSIMIDAVTSEEDGSSSYTNPMQLRVIMPTGSLVCHTDYTFMIQAVVKKSGQEYLIPVNMTNNRFTTKKTLPEVVYDDLFLAADVAEFLNLRIKDKDGTILNDGEVTVYLYYGNSILSVKKIKANGSGENLRFDGLIDGGAYTLKFVAAAYNDADGYGSYQTDYVLESYDLVGGSALRGDLNLQRLERNRGGVGANLVDFNNVYKGIIHDTRHQLYPSDQYRTYYMRCEPNTTYLITSPAGALQLRAACYAGDDLADKLTSRPQLTGYEEFKNVSTTRTMRYTTTADAQYLVVHIGYLTNSSNLTEASIRDQFAVRKYDETAKEDAFLAEIRTTVTDSKGYLGRAGESGKVKLTIKRSDSMEMPSYNEVYKELELELVKQEDGTLTLDQVDVLASLPANSGWQITLHTTYKGSPVTLDTITFRTDADYVTVSNHRELLAAQRQNSNANILVVSDFVQDQNTAAWGFGGTIDFQGHVVTRPIENAYYFLTLQQGAKVRNLVYDYPRADTYVNKYSIFYNRGGLVENLIVRTYGEVVVDSIYHSIIGLIELDGCTLRNFIVQLGGDLVTQTAGEELSAVVASNGGLVENGYVYGKNGAGFVARGDKGGGLFSASYKQTSVRNIYVLMDSWYEPAAATESGLLTRFGSGQLQRVANCYGVGDYYQVGKDEGRTYLLPSDTARFTRADASASIYGNTWALTARKYNNTGTSYHGDINKLYDIDWQEEILGSAFDVAGCVPMGFYPRLNLPVCMQKYQEYIPLPVLGDNAAPKVVSDDWADGEYTHELERGYIKLRMRNDRNYSVTGVTIDGLITSVVNQRVAADGLYDVILNVQVNPEKPSYVGSYQVTSVQYNNGSTTREVKQEYTTKNIEFWKEVATATDWTRINDNMGWNYKLTQDIDFSNSGVLPQAIILNGSTTSFDTSTRFTGKLDGQEHIISGIRLQNLKTPFLIWRMEKGEVRNLLVEDMVISSARISAYSYCGMVYLCNSGSVMENVRLRNCQVAGSGYMGLLVGYVAQSRIQGCSAVDSVLTDVDTGKVLYAGGLVGYAGTSLIQDCYTRNVTMTLQSTVAVRAVGGLLGYQGSGILRDSYSHGSITVSGNYVGGLVGEVTNGDNAPGMQNWTYVDIRQTSGNYAGGSHGRSRDENRSVVLGNVAGSGPETARYSALQFATLYEYNRLFYYDGQVVTGVAQGDKGTNTWLTPLSGAELGKPTTWQDRVRLGSAWNYDVVSEGSAPLLLSDCSREGWQQQKVDLPGQGDDPTLSLVEARYLGAEQSFPYQMTAKLSHPGLSCDAVQALYSSKAMTIDLDGMDLSDDAISIKKSTEVTLQPSSTGAEESFITVKTKTFAKALDIYELRVAYTEESGRERKLTAQVRYLNSDGTAHENWWRISDLSEWDALMPEHGKTEENVLITGTVDFAGSPTRHKDLVFNRLKGETKGNGFKNLRYASSNSGEPWIQKVSVSMENLTFESMDFNFKSTNVLRPMTGAILSIGSAADLTLQSIHLTCNQYSNNYFAFISMATGQTQDVTMDDINVKDVDGTRSRYSDYIGGLIAYASASVEQVKATNVVIDAPRTNYTGGICGRTDLYGSLTQGDTIENFSITGNGYVGGLAGYTASNVTTGNRAVNGSVKGRSSVGGLYGANYMASTAENHQDWLIDTVEITAEAGAAGGALGSTGQSHSNNAVVRNCTIKGTTAVGGLIGYRTGNAYNSTHYNTQILGCKILNEVNGRENKNVNGDPSAMGTGGVYGLYTDSYQPRFFGAVVRDCLIQGWNNVGGYAGALTNAKLCAYENIYVAEDVTIIANNQAAGGIIGSGDNVAVTNCAVGANITAFTNAGGIIGEVRLWNEEITAQVNNCYCKGRVTALGDYAGGVIGKVLDAGMVRLTDKNLNNVLVAADMRSGGESISLWANSAVANTSPGTGLVYICEDSLLNGQTAKAIVDAAGEGKATDVTPQRPIEENRKLLVPAADFAKQTFYTDKGFSDKAWDFSDLASENPTYMPFTKLYSKDGTAQGVRDTAKTYNGKSVGILLPEVGALGQEAVVYASGVDRINVEVPLPEGVTSAEVSVNGQTYTTDENGVVTLGFRFDQEVVIGNVTAYQASDLARKVMTYDKWWYYIAKDGTIHYGAAVGDDADAMKEKENPVAGVEHAVHLWRGYAMTETGEVYQLDGGTATKADAAAAANGEKLDTTPFWTDAAVVYHNFSNYKNTKIPYRVFALGDTPYMVSPAQNVVYDGVVLSQKSVFGENLSYYALLGNDGTLTAYRNDVKLGTLNNKDIAHISNNLGYTGTVLLAYYKDGNVIGVDYSTGDTVCSTLTSVQSFVMYARRTIAGIFGGGGVPVDGSFLDAEAVKDRLETGGVDQSGGAAIGGGTGANGTAVTKPGETETPAGGSDTAAGTGESVEVTGDAQSGGQSQAAGAGESVPDQTGTDSGAAGGETGAAGNVTDIPTGGDGTPDGEITGAGNTDNAGSDPDTSETSGGSDGTAGAQDGQAEAQSSVLMELFGSAVPAYSTRTGRYELLDTASLSAGRQMTREEAIQQAQAAADQAGDGTQSANGNGSTADKSAEPEQAEGESDFSVAWGPNRSLNAGERQGFTLIALAAVIAGIGLVILYRVVIRKRRK